MTRPTVSDAAERLYAALGAQTVGDDDQWVLLKLCDALAAPLAQVDTLAADSDAGPGWSALFDLDRCPPEALPYLAQFVGVKPLAGLDDAAQRYRVASTEGWKRGTPAAIIAAAKQWLTGAQTVHLVERLGGDAYRIRVTAYQAQAVDVDQVRVAVTNAVPAGIIADVRVDLGWSYADLKAAYAGKTYADLKADYVGKTYDDLRRVIPSS